MTVDIHALEAAAANGNKGLAVYDEQKQALQAARTRAIDMLTQHGYGHVDTAGLTGAVDTTSGRGLATLGAQQKGAWDRQGTLAGVPSYLTQEDALTGAEGGWHQAQQGESDRLGLARGVSLTNVGLMTKEEEARKQREFDQRMWDTKFRLQRHLPPDWTP